MREIFVWTSACALSGSILYQTWKYIEKPEKPSLSSFLNKGTLIGGLCGLTRGYLNKPIVDAAKDFFNSGGVNVKAIENL